MMATVLEQVEQAIKRGDALQARQLLHEELLSNPSAEAYYLASLVAFDEEQQREFLEKALAIYPFHKKAYLQMERIKRVKGTNIVEIPFLPIVPRHVTEFPFATFMSRFTALLIDGFIIAIPLELLLTLLVGLGLIPTDLIPSISVFGITFLNAPNPYYLMISGIISAVLNILYYVYFLTRQDGQTFGKSLRGIQVVSLTGGNLTWRQAFIRTVPGYFVSTTFLYLGYLWAISDPNHQTWHDKFAKTIVIKTRYSLKG